MIVCLEIPERFYKLRAELNRLAKEYDIELRNSTNDCQVLAIVGTDRDVLSLISIHDTLPPLLTIAPPGYSGYLTSVSWDGIEDALYRLSRKDFSLRSITRLRAIIDERVEVLAINEVAVFPQRSATLMEYTLRIDDELIWRDQADGVIIATPLGSTAYALSAGGPIVLLNANVFVVVPVNSTELSHRPLIVPQTSRISIGDLASRNPIEVICDGIKRLRVEERVVISQGHEVKFVDIEKSVATIAKKKLKTFQELQSLPPSAKFVYKMLELEGPMTVRDLSLKTLLPERTIRYALNILIDKGLVEKFIDPRDPRRHLYNVRRSFR